MEKYIKIPTRTYKSSEITAKLSQKEDDEISDIYRKAGVKYEDEPELSCVLTWMRVPLKDLEGCSYDSISSIENSDEEFEDGVFTSSLILLKGGGDIGTVWSIEQLEDMLIKHGIVDPDVKNQEEFL